MRKERCENCQKRGVRELQECSRCIAVSYCSKECQVSHWKAQHKKDCARLQSEGELELGTPTKIGKNEIYMTTTKNAKYTYGPPSGLKKADERFWIKVQSNGMNDQLMIYDKSRTCHFLLPQGQNGHRELVVKVSQQKTFLGRKSYFKAKFNKNGRCVVYPHTSTALKW